MARLSLLPLLLVLTTGRALATPMTADDAVRHALQHSTQAIQADASVLDSKAGLWSAYAGVLPSVSGAWSVSRTKTDPSSDHLYGYSGATPYEYQLLSSTSTTTSPTVTGRWSILNLSNLSTLGSALQQNRASRLSRQSVRNDIALAVRSRFYEVVRNIHLAGVAGRAARLARDNERRVQTLFEVGSVSKSDLLKARVATGQSVVDSLVSDHLVTSSRIALANAIGMSEDKLGEVDTTLSDARHDYDEATVLTEARNARPDLKAAEADLRSAELASSAARWSRLPYLSASASGTFHPHTENDLELRFFTPGGPLDRAQSSTQRSVATYSTSLALSWDFLNLGNDARSASAHARLLRSRETRDAIVRALASDVHQAMLSHQEAIEREDLAKRTLESATESLNLVQQKYNVGSATILDLIDSQIQYQRAQGDLVSAKAAIRVSEATLDRVRGRGE